MTVRWLSRGVAAGLMGTRGAVAGLVVVLLVGGEGVSVAGLHCSRQWGRWDVLVWYMSIWYRARCI